MTENQIISDDKIVDEKTSDNECRQILMNFFNMLTLIVDCERYKWQWWEFDWEQNIITEKTDTIEIEEFNECFNMLTSIEDVWTCKQ
jgi:hypothetical protein